MYDPIIALLCLWAWGMLIVQLTATSRRTSGTRPGARTTGFPSQQTPAQKATASGALVPACGPGSPTGRLHQSDPGPAACLAWTIQATVSPLSSPGER